MGKVMKKPWCRFQGMEERGFSLIELCASMVLLLTGIVFLASTVVSASHHHDCITAERLVMAEIQSLVEEMRGLSPDLLLSSYGSQSVSVYGVEGLAGGGAAITSSVDSSNSELFLITLSAHWQAGGEEKSFSIGTRVAAQATSSECE